MRLTPWHLIAATVLVAVRCQPAFAHDAPSGWAYPLSCCSGFDCRAVPQTSVRAGPQGYVVQPSGETVGYADARVKPSPDDDYHWCTVGGRDDGRTICLFVPPQAF